MLAARLAAVAAGLAGSLGQRLAPLRDNPRLRRATTWAAVVLLVVLGLGLLVLLATAAHLWSASGELAGYVPAEPSRLYARPPPLEVGEPATRESLAAYLEDLHYGHVAYAVPPSGTYRLTDGGLVVATRLFPVPGGRAGGERLEVVIEDGVITALRRDGRESEEALLEPMLLAAYYDEAVEERRRLEIEEAPEHLVQAVLAAEDDRFFAHEGVSLAGVLRAAWVNLRHNEIRQGGSTITQQLVRNLYLTQDRTLARKLREAVLALLIEKRHPKKRILEAYLNETYMGVSGGVNVIGFGAAARAFLGKDAELLTLSEAALLAGLIQSPGRYAPLQHPEAARARRDWVLGRLEELGWRSPEEVAAARAEPLVAASLPLGRRRAGYFADAMVVEARERFGIEELGGAGYVLHSSLDWGDQQAAGEAIGRGLAALERGWEKGRRGDRSLQAALISIAPDSGAVRAYVGGRDYGASQFDRVRLGRRQAGSAFKPVVFATAFEESAVLPTTFVEDTPIQVRHQGRPWRPRNNDGLFRGTVTVRQAMELSLNIPTVRIGFTTGLDAIRRQARQMGLAGDGASGPALMLGAAEVSPRELVTAYAALAAGGLRPIVHGLLQVVDSRGEEVLAEERLLSRRVLGAEAAGMVTALLQGAVARGTGARVRRHGLGDPLAGKTGTSDRRRDSWFAGYSPDRATVVWVGYDDNSPTRLSGSRGALPLWARFTAAVRPPGGYPPFELPPTLEEAWIDPESGLLAIDGCPTRIREVLPALRVPQLECPLHQLPLDPQEIPFLDARYGLTLPARRPSAPGRGPNAAGTSPLAAAAEARRPAGASRIQVIQENGEVKVIQVPPEESEDPPDAGVS